LSPGALRRFDDLLGRYVNETMVKRLQADTDTLLLHLELLSPKKTGKPHHRNLILMIRHRAKLPFFSAFAAISTG
jgi:hypothetical protein